MLWIPCAPTPCRLRCGGPNRFCLSVRRNRVGLAAFAGHLRTHWSANSPALKPLVSVIVRTRNRPHLLEEALQSVALQSYPNVELVVINDGGQDVGDLVQGYAPAPVACATSHQRRAGGGPPPPTPGLQAAGGDYLLFLDDDDLIDADHISGLVQALQDNPDALAAYAGVRVEGNPQEPIMHPTYDRREPAGRESVSNPRRALQQPAGEHRLPVRRRAAHLRGLGFLAAGRRAYVLSARVDQVSATYRCTGDSGAGISAYDPDRAGAGRQAVVGKWTVRWAPAVLAEQIEMTWSRYMDLEAGFLRLRAINEQAAKTIQALEDRVRCTEAAAEQSKDAARRSENALQHVLGSRSYRLGRLLTAPRRWLVRGRRAPHSS